MTAKPEASTQGRPGTVLAIVAWAVLAAAIVSTFISPQRTEAAGPAFAVLASITSSSAGITSLQCYGTCPGSGPHSHSYPNPIDQGAGGSQPSAWVQLDYLPASVNAVTCSPIETLLERAARRTTRIMDAGSRWKFTTTLEDLT